jgi:hypothetical protein
MLRTLGLMGLAIGFLVISQPFRMTVLNGVGSAVNTLNLYSPLSYVGLGIVVLGGAALSLRSPQRPR